MIVLQNGTSTTFKQLDNQTVPYTFEASRESERRNNNNKCALIPKHLYEGRHTSLALEQVSRIFNQMFPKKKNCKNKNKRSYFIVVG